MHTNDVTTARSTSSTTSTPMDKADPALFAATLWSRMETQNDDTQSVMQRLAESLPDVHMQVSANSASADTVGLVLRQNKNFSATIDPETLSAMAADEGVFDQIRELISELLAAGEEQNIVNAGGEAINRNVTITTTTIRYVEVQRTTSGTVLTSSSLSFEYGFSSIKLLLDLLFDARENTASGHGAMGLLSLVGNVSAWRLEVLLHGSASNSWESSQSVATSSLEVTLQQWTLSVQNGVSSGLDLVALIQIMGLCDPLVLDLGGEGFSLSSAENGVYFDIRGDGSPVRTAFISGNTAFLYLDENGNGIVDDASELFGDYGGYANGWEKLAMYDDNGDGLIDEQDAIYHQLRVWVDTNGDGINQTEESMTLAEAGIASINLNHDGSVTQDEHGNIIADHSTYTRHDGSTGDIAEAWLRTL